jgi:hypothetical protein
MNTINPIHRSPTKPRPSGTPLAPVLSGLPALTEVRPPVARAPGSTLRWNEAGTKAVAAFLKSLGK